MIKAVLFLILFSSVVQAQYAPPGETHYFGEVDFRYMKKIDSFRLISELRVRDTFDDKLYGHIKLGFVYRLLSAIKVGLHYRGQVNDRNLDEWIRKGNQWVWDESKMGFESLASPQIIYRHLLTRQLRAELRLQDDINLTRQRQTLRVRPGLNYFWTNNGESKGNFFLQYEAFLPMDFGDTTVSQHWIYLGSLFPMKAGHHWGVNIAFAEWIWSRSDYIKVNEPDKHYKTSDKAYLLGFVYLFSE